MNSPSAKTTMTPAEFAAHRGVQKSAVSNWKRNGLLVFAEGAGGRREIDVARSEARINAKIDPARGRPTTAMTAAVSATPAASVGPAPTAPAGDALGTVRTELIRSQIVSRNLDNAKRAGELVPFAEFQRLAAENARLARERMHVMARNMAERLAAEKDQRKVTALLAVEIDSAFDSLAAQAERSGEEDDAALEAAVELEADDAEAAEESALIGEAEAAAVS